MTKRAFILNDLHGNYTDLKALSMALEFGRNHNPDHIILLGDICDFESISRFDKSARDERLFRLRHEVEFVRAILAKFGTTFPRASLTLFTGNHEDRLERYIAAKAPELYGLVDLRTLLVGSNRDLQRRLSIVPVRCIRSLGHLYITHGDCVRSHSAYTARAMYDKVGHSILFGHTHRGGVYYRTDAAGNVAGAWENFCLCRFDMPYLSSPPNWQHGWSLVDFNDRRFYVSPVPVVQYNYIYDHVEYQYDPKTDISKDLPTPIRDPQPAQVAELAPIIPSGRDRSRVPNPIAVGHGRTRRLQHRRPNHSHQSRSG